MQAPPYHSIEISSGKFLDLRDPKPIMTLQDVAHGLSNACRFAGQVREFYSVAEHAVFVARRLIELGHTPEIVLDGLHHDDSEAFLGDVTQPLKGLIPNYADLEAKMATAIQEALGLQGPGGLSHACIKEADNWALRAEAWALLPSRGEWLSMPGTFDVDHKAALKAKPPEGLGPDWQPALMAPRLAGAEYIAWHNYCMEAVAHKQLIDPVTSGPNR